MAVIKTERESWLKRIVGAFICMVLGLILFLAAFPLLFWNEGRAVETAAAQAEAEEVCVSVPSNESVDPQNEGRLIHLSGTTATDDVLTDDVFGIKMNGIRLVREVRFYQWQEHKEKHTEKNLGGSTTTTTTYTYRKAWVHHPIPSDDFQEEGHRNCVAMPGIDEEKHVAEHVRYGAFRLSPQQIKRIGGDSRELRLEDMQMATELHEIFNDLTKGEEAEHHDNMKGYVLEAYAIPEHLRSRAERRGNELYIHRIPGNYPEAMEADPEIGDMRVTWKFVGPQVPVSVIAVQYRDTFTPYHAKSSRRAIDIVRDGEWSAESMFADARRNNEMLTWILRLAGATVMFIGLLLLLRPLEVLADVLPFLGNIIGALNALAAFMVAVILSLVTIAVAWVFYRPVLACCLLALAAAVTVWYMRYRKARQA